MVLNPSFLSAPTAAVLLVVAAAVLPGCSDVQPATQQGATPAPQLYDAARDPAVDFAAAVEIARSGNKRILIQVGGNWCGWCHRLNQYIHDHPAVKTALDDGFVMLKVNYSSENKNEAFLNQFPEIPGYPHLFVLDSDGTFLHSQGTAELEEGSLYSEPKVLAFLSQWRK